MKRQLLISLSIVLLLMIATFSPALATDTAITSEVAARPSHAVYTFTDPSLIQWSGTTASTTIDVSGVTGTVTDVNIILNGLAVQTFSAGVEEFDILLAPPSGAANDVILMSFACDATAGPITVTFDMAAGGLMPSGNSGSGCMSGSYLPSDHSALVGGYILDAPAPPPPYGADLSVFNGLDPNGTWTLYFEEFGGNEGGELGSGWTIEITDDTVIGPPPAPPPGITVPNLGLVQINAHEPVQPYGMPGMELQNFILPADYDGNGFDTYVVAEVTMYGGEYWLGLFIGNDIWVWVPYSAVQPLTAISGID